MAFVPRPSKEDESPPSVFLDLPRRDLRAPPPPYARPVLLTTYSHGPDRSITHDDASMSYHRPCPIGADLKYGFERRIERDDGVEEHLDGLVESLRVYELRGGSPPRYGGVISWRGMFTRLLTAPLEDKDGWAMTLIPLAGSIYMEQYIDPEAKARRRALESSWALQTYFGYSYESYSTVPRDTTSEGDDGGPDGWSGDVNTNVQWCNIVRTRIGDIPLTMGGEVDCVDARPGSLNPGLRRTIELKTNKVIQNERQDAAFQKKLYKHWAQSYLLGVPTVQVGFRDDEGIVMSKARFETVKIPRFVAGDRRPAWYPEPGFHFLHACLGMILDNVLPQDPRPEEGLTQGQELPPAPVFRLVFSPNKGVELYRLADVGVEDGRWGGMLPEDYAQWRMRA